MGTSQALTDDIIGLITAFGSPRPTSFGLSELYVALAQAIRDSITGAGYFSVAAPSGDETGYTDTQSFITARNNGLGIRAYPGTYYIAGAANDDGPIVFQDALNFQGMGGSWQAPFGTVIKCVDATAGLEFGGANGGYVGDFVVDGNNVATIPFQRTLIGDNTGYKIFSGIDVINSAQDGITILGAQNDLWMSCGSFNNARDGLYFDFGAGGHTFIQFNTFGNVRYFIHGDALIPDGPYSAGPSDFRFYGGISDAIGTPISAHYFRHCNDVTFDGHLMGPKSTGPQVDIDSTCSSIRYKSIFWEGVETEDASPGIPCIQTAGCAALYLTDLTFGGDCSLSVTAEGLIFADHFYDATRFGIVTADGVLNAFAQMHGAIASTYPAYSSMCSPWYPATLLNDWANDTEDGYAPVSYRLNASGDVELMGGLKSGTSGTIAFNLPPGFYSSLSTRIIQGYQGVIVIDAADGYGTVIVESLGVVAADGTATASSGTFSLDGMSFAVNI
jgi:hypothetical protein